MINVHTKVEVGKFYTVKCAILKKRNGTFCVPVIGKPHKDPQFGVDVLHVHIDGRFMDFNDELFVWQGRTNAIVTIDLAIAKYPLVKFTTRRLKCKGLDTGIKPPDEATKYWKWYKKQIGKSCKGKKCPHLGAIMHEIDGKLVCPLHNLQGDIEKEIIVYPEKRNH